MLGPMQTPTRCILMIFGVWMARKCCAALQPAALQPAGWRSLYISKIMISIARKSKFFFSFQPRDKCLFPIVGFVFIVVVVTLVIGTVLLRFFAVFDSSQCPRRAKTRQKSPNGRGARLGRPIGNSDTRDSRSNK